MSLLYESLGIVKDVEHHIFFPDSDGSWDRFNNYVRRTRNGVITGKCGNQGHAVAVDGIEGVVYDPDGEIYLYSWEAMMTRGFNPVCLWKVQSV